MNFQLTSLLESQMKYMSCLWRSAINVLYTETCLLLHSVSWKPVFGEKEMSITVKLERPISFYLDNMHPAFPKLSSIYKNDTRNTMKPIACPF